MQGNEWYVGIDVANAKIDAAFLIGEACQARPTTSHPNDPEGWTGFRELLAEAAPRGTRLVCGMEATSNMHKGIEDVLLLCSQRWSEGKAIAGIDKLEPMSARWPRQTKTGTPCLIGVLLARSRPRPHSMSGDSRPCTIYHPPLRLNHAAPPAAASPRVTHRQPRVGLYGPAVLPVDDPTWCHSPRSANPPLDTGYCVPPRPL